MKKVPVAIFLVLLASLALVACGSSSSSSSESTGSEPTTESAPAGGEEGGEAESGAGGTLAIEAAASGLEFASNTAEAEAGTVDLEFNNPQSTGHDVAIEDSGGKVIGETEIVSEGGSATSVELKPGTYKFFCTIPGHREAGMEGTLTVK
jgi:plastocyanin